MTLRPIYGYLTPPSSHQWQRVRSISRPGARGSGRYRGSAARVRSISGISGRGSGRYRGSAGGGPVDIRDRRRGVRSISRIRGRGVRSISGISGRRVRSISRIGGGGLVDIEDQRQEVRSISWAGVRSSGRCPGEAGGPARHPVRLEVGDPSRGCREDRRGWGMRGAARRAGQWASKTAHFFGKRRVRRGRSYGSVGGRKATRELR